MVLFYSPPELPMFHGRSGKPESVIVHSDVDPGAGTFGENLPHEHVANGNGKKH
jgi:hypothetical protein